MKWIAMTNMNYVTFGGEGGGGAGNFLHLKTLLFCCCCYYCCCCLFLSPPSLFFDFKALPPASIMSTMSTHIDQDQAIFINSTINNLYEFILSIPGSHIALNYIKTSYHHDPFRIALELFLVFFALKYMFSKKYKPHDNAVKLTRKVTKQSVKWQGREWIMQTDGLTDYRKWTIWSKNGSRNLWPLNSLALIGWIWKRHLKSSVLKGSSPK